MTRIVLAEDHVLVRQALKLLLTTSLGLDVVAETGDGSAVEALVRELKPELLVLDLDLPSCHGIEVAARIKAEVETVKILIVTGSLSAETVDRALAAGADGYVVKHEDSGELLQAIQTVLAGRQYISKAIASLFQRGAVRGAPPPITPREREIIGLIAGGLANRDIADALGISPHTVRTHRQALMAKLDLRNAAEITAYAIKHGLYTPA